jgi:hypothetical protein
VVISPELSEGTVNKLANLVTTPSGDKRFGLDIMESRFRQRSINHKTPKFEVYVDLLRMMCVFPEEEEPQIRYTLTWVKEMYTQLDQEKRNKLIQQTGGRLTEVLVRARDDPGLNENYMPIYWGEVSEEFRGLVALLGTISTRAPSLSIFEPADEASAATLTLLNLRMAS